MRWVRTVPIEESRLVSLYHRLLTWDIVKAPRTTRIAERILTPVLGKSLVVYARKPQAARVGGPVTGPEGGGRCRCLT